MSTDDSWLLDMLTYARRARELTEGVSKGEFLADPHIHYSATHLIMIVGEAAAQVSGETRAKLPEVPWGQIVGTRNRIVHHYFKIDLEILWDVVQVHLPVLIEHLSRVVPPERDVQP